MEKRIFEKVLNGLYNGCGLEPVKKMKLKTSFITFKDLYILHKEKL